MLGDSRTMNDPRQVCLQLLAYFDDYSHPLTMTAEYVREQICIFMDELDNEGSN